MHTICNGCYEKVAPLERLLADSTATLSDCAYCGRVLTGEELQKSHRLPGNGFDPKVLLRLDDVYFQRLAASRLAAELAERPPGERYLILPTRTGFSVLADGESPHLREVAACTSRESAQAVLRLLG